MRVILDTNIFVSFLFWNNPKIISVVEEAFKFHQILHSTESLTELSEVLLRPKFDRYMSLAEREAYLAYFQTATEFVLVKERIQSCRDPRDNKFLELAVSGKANVIVTGDKALLELNPFKGIKIIDVRSFLKSKL